MTDSNHALIVDDSKTAQIRLKRMLERYALEVDLAASAEEALAYLSYRVPAVIFLDQSMQGMNGVEALRTIKANPNTATIPVIMYTSEKGEVFTSQARALGALDILNKSNMATANLDRMLERLKLSPKNIEQETGKAAEQTQLEPPSPLPETTEVHRQIARLFEIHIADVARQITKSTQFLAKRITSADNTKTPPEIIVGDVPLDVIDREVNAERRRLSLTSNILLSSILILLFFGIGLLFNLSNNLKQLSSNQLEASTLVNSNAEQISMIADEIYMSRMEAEANSQQDQKFLSTLSWLANTDFSFNLNELPLGDAMVPKLQQLTSMLAKMDYQGIIEINIHFGNACMEINVDGELSIARADLPFFDCVMRASESANIDTDDLISLAYLEYERSSPELQDRKISLVVNPPRFDAPRIPYPLLTETITSSEWNRVAQQNNFLAFAFYPYN